MHSGSSVNGGRYKNSQNIEEGSAFPKPALIENYVIVQGTQPSSFGPVIIYPMWEEEWEFIECTG